ncbi:MAG: tetratricopeptide repeat protein [Saprospiraceae bacterium]|nr:tetratricopeptide repeat protein [Saprospiraceae bacterium]
MNFLSDSITHRTLCKRFRHLQSVLLCAIPLSISAQITNQAQAARISEAEVQLQEKYMGAVVQQQIGKLDGAAKLFNEVLEKNPKCDGCAFQLSRLYDKMGDNQRAIDFAKKAVAIDVKNKWYQIQLAETYEKIGKDREAIDVYKTIVEKNDFEMDFSEEMYFRLAHAHVRVNEPSKAIKVLEDLEKKTGINEDITDKKRLTYEVMNDLKKAAGELKKLADAYPQVIEYQHQAAEYFLKLGDKATAMTYYERILKRDPNDSKARMALAVKQAPSPTESSRTVSNASNGNADVAFLNSLRDVFQKPEIKIDEKIKAILPYVNKIAEGKDKQLATAGLQLAEIVERAHPTDAKSYSLLGDMLYHNGRATEALAKYKKCLELNKSIYAVWEQKMYTEEELGLYDDLLKTSEEAADLFPNQAIAFYFNGLANERKGKYEAAVSSLEQAILMSAKKPPLKLDALVELGITYSKSKNYTQSDKTFEDALKLNAKSPIAMIRYANALVGREGLGEKAKQMADEALKLTAESDPSVLEGFGDYLFKSGEKQKAVQYWQKAKERGAKSAVLDKKITEKLFVE